MSRQLQLKQKHSIDIICIKENKTITIKFLGLRAVYN